MIQLSGTPSPNGLTDLWSQMYLLDEGAALGKTITAFRDRFCLPVLNNGVVVSHRIRDERAEAEIHAAISHMVLSDTRENTTLPEIYHEDIVLEMEPKLQALYEQLRRNMVLELVSQYTDENNQLVHSVQEIVALNKGALYAKLLQFASGILFTTDPDDPSTQGCYTAVHDLKLRKLQELVTEQQGEPLLVAYHFVPNREQILAAMAEIGVTAKVFDGSRTMYQDWNARKIPVMLLHPASSGHGLNLQDGGADVVWFTLPYALNHYQQLNARLRRTGQRRAVRVRYLLTQDTRDMAMPGILGRKAQVQDNLMLATDPNQLHSPNQYEASMTTSLHHELSEDFAAVMHSNGITEPRPAHPSIRPALV